MTFTQLPATPDYTKLTACMSDERTRIWYLLAVPQKALSPRLARLIGIIRYSPYWTENRTVKCLYNILRLMTMPVYVGDTVRWVTVSKAFSWSHTNLITGLMHYLIYFQKLPLRSPALLIHMLNLSINHQKTQQWIILPSIQSASISYGT